jgi:hypothetical protein
VPGLDGPPDSELGVGGGPPKNLSGLAGPPKQTFFTCKIQVNLLVLPVAEITEIYR